MRVVVVFFCSRLSYFGIYLQGRRQQTTSDNAHCRLCTHNTSNDMTLTRYTEVFMELCMK